MTDNLKQLKSNYRNIKAPPYLATRIRANVADRAPRQRSWVSAITAAVAVAVISVTIILLQQQPSQTMTSPSFATLSRMMPDRPAVPVPSLSNVRSIKTPALPPKPKLNQPNTEQTYFDFENSDLKETDHA